MSSERFGQKVRIVKRYFQRLVVIDYIVFLPSVFAASVVPFVRWSRAACRTIHLLVWHYPMNPRNVRCCSIRWRERSLVRVPTGDSISASWSRSSSIGDTVQSSPASSDDTAHCIQIHLLTSSAFLSYRLWNAAIYCQRMKQRSVVQDPAFHFFETGRAYRHDVRTSGIIWCPKQKKKLHIPTWIAWTPSLGKKSIVAGLLRQESGSVCRMNAFIVFITNGQTVIILPSDQHLSSTGDFMMCVTYRT